MIKFIFFGRLVYEKGIDVVIDAFSYLHKTGITNWYIEIYGEGPFMQACKDFAALYPRNVILHSRASQQTIQHTLQGSHYCIMPSRVLESFGMSALESLQQGVPVIGTKAGGLEQFVEDQHNTLQTPLHKILQECIEEFSLEKWKMTSTYAQEKAKRYSKDSWLKTIEKICDIKRTFLISDYISKIGGIESIVHAIKKLFEKEGAQVTMLGWKIAKGKRQSLYRKIGLIGTSFNLPLFARIHYRAIEEKPTLIRLHSINRFLGRLPIAGIQANKKNQIICTIHDLGMFHPFGANVRHSSDIPHFSLGGFTALTKNIVKKILITLKFANLRMIKKQLQKKVDIRTVPSGFMIDILHQKWDIPKEKILLLPHFIS